MSFVKEFVKQHNVAVLSVTETSLTTDVPSSFVHIDGYRLVRGDTDGATRKHGTCIFISEQYRFVELEVDIPNLCGIHLLDLDVCVISVYRPPSYKEDQNTTLINALTDLCGSMETIILGDFNLSSVRWSLQGVLPGYVPPHVQNFLDCFTDLGLTQWVTEATFSISGNTLDLFLTTESDRTGDVYVLPPFPRCFHSPVLTTYFFQNIQSTPVKASPRLVWCKGRYNAISVALNQYDWKYEFKYFSVNDNYEILLDILKSLLERYIPVGNEKIVPWAVKPPRSMLRLRSQLWTDFKTARRRFGRHDNHTLQCLKSFHETNDLYRNFELNSRSEYELNLVYRAQDAPKLFHSYIRNKKLGRPSVGPLRMLSGQVVDCPSKMCEIFADSFASVFVPEIPSEPARLQFFPGVMDDFDISRKEVEAALLALDVHSSAGPDGLHPYLLKKCAVELSYPLHIIFTKSFNAGVVPKLWSCSRVTPLFKGKSRLVPLNYRPVSITSVPCKVLERIIAGKLMDYLEHNNLLSRFQFGFRRGRSTEDQLLITYSFIADCVDKGEIVDAILLDFTRAFDVVSHALLLMMLQALGIPDRVVDWVAAFLGGRVMEVACSGAVSTARPVLSGVPQGSVLGPVLFLIYVNHITAGISCHFTAFADDYKLYFSFSRREDAILAGVQSLQRDLDSVSSTARSWNLKLNSDKCVVMRYHRGRLDLSGNHYQYYLNGIKLATVSSHKDLGVVVDQSLRFHEHVQKLVSKASSLASNLLRSTVNRSPEFMVKLFVSHVRPILDYCSCVWNVGYLGDSRRIESVQRRWTACVRGLDGMDYGQRLRTLGLFSLRGRRLRADLIKYWKFLSAANDTYMFKLSSNTRTRGHALKLSMPSCHTDIKSKFFNVRCISMWNVLPANVAEADSLQKFKNRLQAHLSDELYYYD